MDARLFAALDSSKRSSGMDAILRTAVLALATAPGVAVHAAAGDTDLVSLGIATARACDDARIGFTGPNDSVSAGGRFVVFSANARAMGTPGVNRYTNSIFLRDRQSNETLLVSHDESGAARPGWDASISASGSHVVFATNAALLASDTNGTNDVYVFTVATQALERASVTSDEAERSCGEFYSVGYADVSRDGRYVAFASCADLTARAVDDDGEERVFLRDRTLGTTEVVFGGARRGDTGYLKWGHKVSVSDDGRWVYDRGLLHDRELDVVSAPQLHSQAALEVAQERGFPDIRDDSLSADGHFIVFSSDGPDVEPGDTNGYADIFVRDLRQHTTDRISLDQAGEQYRAQSLYPQISADGHYVAFYANLHWAPGAGWQGLTPIGWEGIYVRDRLAGTVEYASVDRFGGPAATYWYPSLSADGRFVAFSTRQSLQDEDGRNAGLDVYVHERGLIRIPVYHFVINPSAIDFGDAALGTYPSERFWIRNRGPSALPIRLSRMIGEQREFFARSGGRPQLVLPGQDLPIRVTLRAIELGAKKAALLVVAGTDTERVNRVEANVVR